jgi:hypothetical protein
MLVILVVPLVASTVQSFQLLMSQSPAKKTTTTPGFRPKTVLHYNMFERRLSAKQLSRKLEVMRSSGRRSISCLVGSVLFLIGSLQYRTPVVTKISLRVGGWCFTVGSALFLMVESLAIANPWKLSVNAFSRLWNAYEYLFYILS